MKQYDTKKYNSMKCDKVADVLTVSLRASAVRLALWKKAVIGGFCVLLLLLLLLASVLFYRSKRGRETYRPPAAPRPPASYV